MFKKLFALMSSLFYILVGIFGLLMMVLALGITFVNQKFKSFFKKPSGEVIHV